MIEIPEAIVLSQQVNEHLSGKTIREVIANHSPHKFAWFYGLPEDYAGRLEGETIMSATASGGFLEILLDGSRLLFSEGVKLTYLGEGENEPKKHQLLLKFEDGSVLAASIQMYGGLWCFQDTFDHESFNEYYQAAKTKPSPLKIGFEETYFRELIQTDELMNKSVKAALATEQRIPGLGNGVLQDILFNAMVHPKRKINTLTDQEFKDLFSSVKTTLHEMVIGGGRDTESDLFGCKGGYKTKMSKLTVGKPCEKCGQTVVKKSYMGGSIYFCPGCQPEAGI